MNRSYEGYMGLSGAEERSKEMLELAMEIWAYPETDWNGNKNLDSFFKFVFQKFYRA